MTAIRTTLPTLAKYARHSRATLEWLMRSVEHGRGGSSAHFSFGGGWSKPYPETSGYLVPTLLELEREHPDLGAKEAARGIGRWLLSIQNTDGSWNGGLHPSRTARASVFNTGQILEGMLCLHRDNAGAGFLSAAARGANWLVSKQDSSGLWPAGDYRASATPSYYTHVLWPMLEVWLETGEHRLRASAEAGLAAILARKRDNGSIERWGFGDGDRAFTHTIAYTLRGLLECSRILDAWDDIGSHAVPALERMLRKSELNGARLAGEFDAEWNATSSFECLTGSAQTAINLLLWEREVDDLRIVSAAARLVDRVCDTQNLRHPMPGIRGAVAGSWPIWGRYMTLRYPNWAAKYHCDALSLVTRRVEQIAEVRACA
jgi:hypothetical protein